MPGDRRIAGDNAGLRRRIAADNARLRAGGLGAWPPGDRAMPGDDTRLRVGSLGGLPPGDQMGASGARHFGGLSFVLSKESPPDPERKALFFCLRQETDVRRTIAALTATLSSAHLRGSYDLVGFWPARIVTQRLLGGLVTCTLPQQPQPPRNGTGGPQAQYVSRIQRRCAATGAPV